MLISEGRWRQSDSSCWAGIPQQFKCLDFPHTAKHSSSSRENVSLLILYREEELHLLIAVVWDLFSILVWQDWVSFDMKIVSLGLQSRSEKWFKIIIYFCLQMKKSFLWQQDFKSVASGVECWSTPHVKGLLGAWLENVPESPSLVS